jgi:hypothetical protein
MIEVDGVLIPQAGELTVSFANSSDEWNEPSSTRVGLCVNKIMVQVSI